MSGKAGRYYITIRFSDRADRNRVFVETFGQEAYDRNHAIRLARQSVDVRKYTVESISAVKVG